MHYIIIMKPTNNLKSGFREYATQYKFIKRYEALKEKELRWAWRPMHKVEVPICKRKISSEPPQKKRK